MTSENVFHKLRIASKENLPGNLEKILIASGYETESALLDIGKSSIQEIETYINENKHFLQNTAYEFCFRDNTVFKLKPGHKSNILSIPNLIRGKNKNKKQPNFENKENGNANENGIVEEKNENDLKVAIINKIVKFANDRSFLLTLDTSDIIDFEKIDNKFKCSVRCPVCSKQIRCEYKSYWIVSNLQKHLKNHFRLDVETIIVNPPNGVLSYADEHMDLDNVLKD